MTRPWRTLALLLTMGAGVGLLGSLVYQYTLGDVETRQLNEARNLIFKLVLDEGHLRESVLRARHGLDPNYDAISNQINEIQADLRTLNELQLPASVGIGLAQYKDVLDQETERAESFKSYNAVVRNALAYFLFELERLLPRLPDTGVHSHLQHDLGEVVLGVTQRALEVTPRHASEATIRDTERLLEKAGRVLPSEKGKFEMLARHARVIYEQLPELAATVSGIVNSGSRTLLGRVQTSLDVAIKDRFASDQGQRLTMQLLLAGLFVGLLLLGTRYLRTLQLAATQRNFLQGLTDNVGVGVVVVEGNDRISFVNPEAEHILGFPSGALTGRGMHEGLHVTENGESVAEQACEAHLTVLQGGRHQGEVFLKAYDGRILPVLEHSAGYDTAEGRSRIMVFQDMAERKQAEATLRKLSQAIEQSPASIVITNLNAEIEYVNEAFVRNTGYSREEVLGKNPRILHSGRTSPQTYLSMWTALTAGEAWQGEFINRRKDGSEYIESVVMAPTHQDDGRITHYVAVKEDVTAKKAAEEEARYLAFFDALTNLPNRRLLGNRIEHALSLSKRSGTYGALIMLDLDHFKKLNDTQGHEMGDRLLKQVADRLKSSFRNEDTVARLGGDEFVVLVEGLGNTEQVAVQNAGHLGAKILAALGKPYGLADSLDHFVGTASLGVTLFGGGKASVESLLKQADVALYQAKDAGRNAVRFFNPKMQADIDERIAIEQALRVGIDKREFVLHYQPQVDQDGIWIGAEALIRWNHPTRGWVSPAEFIPVAEDSGLIVDLGRWVIKSACAQLRSWAGHAALGRLSLSVNVSARQFHQPGFVDCVRKALADSGANPEKLKLELTESVILEKGDHVVARMRELSQLGVRFSLDDFGTGYSSLSYLKRLPFNQIKIDQSFVRGVPGDRNDAAIVEAILAMSDSLRLEAVAEGVETQEQRAFLQDGGCGLYQGYLFGRPSPIEEFEAAHEGPAIA